MMVWKQYKFANIRRLRMVALRFSSPISGAGGHLLSDKTSKIQRLIQLGPLTPVSAASRPSY